MAGLLKVQWVRSKIGQIVKQRETLKGLGFRRMQQVRFLPDDPQIRGMLTKVNHLVTIEKVNKEEKPEKKKLETYRLGSKAKAKPKAAKPKKAATAKEAKKDPKQKTKASTAKKKPAAPKQAKTTKSKA